MKPLQVLIADDNPGYRELLCAQLSELGHQVIGQAQDGQEAVYMARQLRPDLMMLDIRMPRMDGLETCAQIEDEGLCPIVILSAYSDLELVRRAARLHVHGYLVKPVEEQELEPALEVAVARFEETQKLHQEVAQLRDILETRTDIERAIDCLTRDRQYTYSEAVEWLHQEARVKRASLAQVARAVVHGKPLDYCYAAPV